MLEWLFSQDFVDYGYKKTTHWLKREGFHINHKRVYNIMKENKWLQNRWRRDKSGKTIAKEIWRNVTEPFRYLQMDIKYIHIVGMRRNALLLSVIDVCSRGILGYKLQWQMRKEDVIDLMQEILSKEMMPAVVTLRNDNGSQFEANIVRNYLKEIGVEQEFTHPATPDENCYIESYHSIIESVICRKFDLESLEEAQEKIGRFLTFYNQERLHSGLKMQSPQKYLTQNGIKACLPEFIPYTYTNKKPNLAQWKL